MSPLDEHQGTPSSATLAGCLPPQSAQMQTDEDTGIVWCENPTFQSTVSSATYYSRHSVPTHICPSCGKGFRLKLYWKIHIVRCAADTKRTPERMACAQEGCNFLCSSEDDLEAHIQHSHEGSIELVAAGAVAKKSKFKLFRNAIQDHVLPFHCKLKPEAYTQARSDISLTDAKLKGDAPNDFRTPGNNVKCGLEPNKNKRLERSTSQLPNTEAIYSSHHDIPQQAKLRRSEDYSELPQSSKEDHSMHNELVKLTVTKFLGEMLDKAMSSFDISSHRSLEDCAEDESDSDNDELDDYDSDTEQFPASGTRNIGSFSNTDGYSIQSTSSNTSCGFSSRPSASESGSSSQTISSGGENKGKGHPVVSPEYRNKRGRKISPSKGRNDQDDGRGSDDENEPVEKRKLSEFYINGKNLACPFYQRRPQLHPKSTACIHPGFKTIARLKEHLYRQHYRISCPRCGQNFEQEDELKIHLRAKVVCESTEEEPSEEYMTTQQRDQLRSKKRKAGQDTLEKKWESIYQLLFPDDMPPLPSPYCEPTVPRPTSSSSSNMADFQDFCFQQLRYLLMKKFQSDLRTLEPVVQTRLKDSMDEILREAPAQIHRQWEEQRHALASPSSQGSNQAGLNSCKSASNNQAEIDAAITQAQPTEPGRIEDPDLGAPTAEGGAQSTIAIPGLSEHPNGLSESHNETLDIWGSEEFNKPLVDHAGTAAMSADLDPEQQAQIFPQISEDPFIPLDTALLMEWDNSFFEPLNFDTDMDTAIMDKSALEPPGRRSDSPLEPLLQKRPEKDDYPQNGSYFYFEGPGTMVNAEIEELTSDLWDLDSSTAQHTAGHHSLCPISLDEAESRQTRDCNGKVEQPDLSMIGFLEEHEDGSFLPPLCPQPNPNVSGSNGS